MTDEAFTIIGIGSPYGDDQLGWLTVDVLEQQLNPPVHCLKLDRPGPELLRYFQGTSSVVLVDAILEDSQTTTRELQVDELIAITKLTSSHGFELSKTLALGDTLDLLPQQLRLFGVPMRRRPDSKDQQSDTEALTILARTAARTIMSNLGLEHRN